MNNLNKIEFETKLGRYNVHKIKKDGTIYTDFNFIMLDNVIGAVIDSTWGNYMSCGATNVKEIEKNGISIVQICDLVFVDLMQGINKIVPAISIPYPLGDSITPKEEQYELRSIDFH